MLGILAAVLILLYGGKSAGGTGGVFENDIRRFKKVCYVTNWSLTRAEARFSITDIAPSLCTHFIYAFANIDVESLSLVPSLKVDVTEGDVTGNYEKLNDLKKDHPEMRTLLSVGGALAGTSGFDAVSETLFSRKKFSINVVKFLRRWKFDGLDVDWEFPNLETKSKFTLLIQELRVTFDRHKEKNKPPLLLSAAVGVSETQITQSYEVHLIADLLDFINVMSYDFHGSWDNTKITGLNSPLFSRSARDTKFDNTLSVMISKVTFQDWALNRWIAAGAQPEKLLLGVAAEGRTFTLADKTRTDIGSPFVSAGEAGAYTKTEGALAYFEICELVYKGVTRRWDGVQQGPYLYRDSLWVGYDSPRSVGIKSSYVMRKGLGGVMLWALDLDDFSGNFCKKGRYPLLTTVNKVLDGKTIVTIDWPSGAERVLPHSTHILGLSVIFVFKMTRFN
ncbi:chitotriosidase-1 [Lingula anatina]|uniref:Chitotriosidase-1 n=1 Tax=Lingula anatina TaxID=7574 RepID=A0A1S3JL51_LINAN|nr:chitotriosidase-1 [Lingula anatina]|eukprot:XP_013411097.1 chitotriosidase-1 [Lingula anatina]